MATPNHYATLGIPKDASPEQIKAAAEAKIAEVKRRYAAKDIGYFGFTEVPSKDKYQGAAKLKMQQIKSAFTALASDGQEPVPQPEPYATPHSQPQGAKRLSLIIAGLAFAILVVLFFTVDRLIFSLATMAAISAALASYAWSHREHRLVAPRKSLVALLSIVIIPYILTIPFSLLRKSVDDAAAAQAAADQHELEHRLLVEDFNADREGIIHDIRKKMEGGDLGSARSITRRYLPTGDPDLAALDLEITQAITVAVKRREDEAEAKRAAEAAAAAERARRDQELHEKQGLATRLCSARLRAIAKYPSSLDIHDIMGIAYRTEPDGQIYLQVEFEWKNGLGIEIPQLLKCRVKGSLITYFDYVNR